MKGKRFRVEMTMLPAGKQIVIGGPDGVYLLVTGMKEAMKLPAQAAAQLGPSSITPDLAKLRQQKKVGSEKVGRYQADIYEQHAEVQMPGQATKVKTTTRLWISRDVPVPVKTVSTVAGGYRTVSILKSAKVNATIADTLFTLPKGTKVHSPGR
jgi:outer membrane lipoprotein-sorting protein